MDEGPAGCQRRILTKKKVKQQQQQQQQQQTKTRSSKTTAKLITVYCILFSKQFFGWPYQPPQVYRCYCSGLHFPFHPPFDLSYRTPQPFIMLEYPAWASTLDTTVQKRWFFLQTRRVYYSGTPLIRSPMSKKKMTVSTGWPYYRGRPKFL